MNVISYTDGDFTSPVAISRPRLSQPFAGDAGEYMLKQDFMVNAANFSPLALSTAYPSDPFTSYILTGESELQNRDAGVVTWTRTYCQIPSQRNDGASMAYRFIGYQAVIAASGGITTAYTPGRNRFVRTVPSRIQHDYFLATDPTTIALIQEQFYYVPLGSFAVSGTTGTYTKTYPDGNPLQALTGNPVDYLFDAWAIGGFSSPQGSVPTLSDYKAIVVAGGYIVAQASTLSRWQGNIWDRATVYVLAQ